MDEIIISNSMLARFRPTQLLTTYGVISARMKDDSYDLPWAIRERVERLLDQLVVLLEPALRPESLDALAPHARVPVDCVRGDGEDRALWEELSTDSQAALWNEPGKTDP